MKLIAAAALLSSALASPVSYGDLQTAMSTLAGTPGVVGAIGELYVDGRRVGHGSAGSRLLGGKGGAIPSGARYRAGSQTKLMTSTVIRQLVRQGKLSLEDRLGALLPGSVERADEITVGQLLQHTSGIPDFWASQRLSPFDFTTYYSPAELVKLSASVPRTGEPGEKFSYSNTNYVLLGMIIEKVTGHSMAEELRRRIFAPLGMKDSYLPLRPPQGITGPHGHGYAPDEQGVLRDVDRQNASFGYAAGGVISTARDLSAFQRAYAQGRLVPVGSAPPSGGGGPALPCAGKLELRAAAGAADGFQSVTFTTPDGRTQLALSTTLTLGPQDRGGLDPAINRAAEAVLCP